MNDKFKKALTKTLGLEGGFSNHENDKGGPTNFGITESKAREHGFKGSMEDLTLNQASEIYYKDYWKKEFEDFGSLVSSFLFDCCVNHGYGGMSSILQRSINMLTKNNVKVDSYAGKQTYSSALKLNQEKLYVMLNSCRVQYFLNICEKNESQESFIFGWLKNRIFWSEVENLIKKGEN
jgi:lysozyme family protein